MIHESTSAGPATLVDSLVERAMRAALTEDGQGFADAMAEVATHGLGEDVHAAYLRLVDDDPRMRRALGYHGVPSLMMDPKQRDRSGFYALLSSGIGTVNAATFAALALEAGVPLPVAECEETPHGLSVLRQLCANAYLAPTSACFGQVLEQIRREPMSTKGRNMLDWLNEIGEAQVQQLQGFENFCARVNGHLAMVRAAQALQRLEAARASATPPSPSRP